MGIQHHLLIFWPFGMFSGGSGSPETHKAYSWRAHLQTVLCLQTQSCSPVVPCNKCPQPLPADTAKVFVSSDGISLFFVTLELGRVCFKHLVNLCYHWYEYLNYLEYTSFWILGMFIFLSENSLWMLRVLFSLTISRDGEQNMIGMVHDQFMAYLFHTAG